MRMALLMLAVAAMALSPAMAAEGVAPAPAEKGKTEKAQKTNKPADPVVQELRSAENPHIARVEQKARELTAPLSQPQMKTVLALRESYGLIRSVEIVQRDIGRAVRLCGEDNRDLKDPMAARFKKWSSVVDPVLKERMGALQDAIDKQDFTKPEKIRGYFKALDDAAIYAEKKFDKRVITTEEACKSLLQSMDGTQHQVAEIMKDLKVPEIAPAEEAAEKDAVPAGKVVPKDPDESKKAD